MPAFEWLLAEDLRQSWYELFRLRKGLTIQYARTIVGATLADAEAADHLGIAAGSALLHLRRQTYTQGHQLIAYTSALYRSDRYQFSVSLARRPNAMRGRTA
jgi:DNA-binding GntR family transcriptional regulator